MAANVNNYIAAGNAAVKNTYASLAAARDNAPKYDEIAKQGMKARTEEKVTAMKADAAVKATQIKADAYLKRNDIKLDLNKSLGKSQKKTQFAGKIAAAGAVMATALMPSAEIIKPGTIDFSRSETRIREGLADIDKQIEGLGKPQPKTNIDTPKVSNAPNTSPGTLSVPTGSVFITGNTGVSTGAHLHAGIWSKSKGGYIDPTGRLGQYITGPDGQALSSYTRTSGYGPRPAPKAGASTNHRGIDFGMAEGTKLNISLNPASNRPRFFDSGGGYMSAYTIDDDLELVLGHGQRLPGER